MAEIPIVDFGCIGIAKQHDEPVRRLAQEVYNAFATIGFVYIKNHGVEEDKVGEFHRLML